MKHAVVSPICSAMVLGMGQLINRQKAKGSLLVAGMSLWFLTALAVTWFKVTGAMGVVADGPPVENKMDALQETLVSGGLTWLWIIGGIFVVMWLYSVIDAFVVGARIDREGGGLLDEVS